jgi:hypothetical protein
MEFDFLGLIFLVSHMNALFFSVWICNGYKMYGLYKWIYITYKWITIFKKRKKTICTFTSKSQSLLLWLTFLSQSLVLVITTFLTNDYLWLFNYSSRWTTWKINLLHHGHHSTYKNLCIGSHWLGLGNGFPWWPDPTYIYGPYFIWPISLDPWT